MIIACINGTLFEFFRTFDYLLNNDQKKNSTFSKMYLMTRNFYTSLGQIKLTYKQNWIQF